MTVQAQVSVVGLLLLLPLYFHPFAFGFADDEGITFCRYFKLHFVPWNAVTRGQRRQWNAFEVVILLSKRVTLTKIVRFPMNLSRQEVDATFRERWIPEILIWLIDHLPSTRVPQPPAHHHTKVTATPDLNPHLTASTPHQRLCKIPRAPGRLRASCR